MSRTPCDAVADHQGAADPRLKTPDLDDPFEGEASSNTSAKY